jgi:hypothetical protein
MLIINMLWVLLLKAVLFYLLAPRVFLALPEGSSLVTQALVHGLVFGIVDHFASKLLKPMFEPFENPDSKVDHPCPDKYEKCPSGNGNCRLIGEIYNNC